MAMHIREQDDYDRTPDPDDMTLTEAVIAERMSTFAGEIATLSTVTKTMTKDMLSRLGFAANEESIIVSILVIDPDETVNWIDHPRQHINLRRVAEHVHADANVFPSKSGKNHLYITRKNGGISDSYICIAGKDND